MIPIGLPTVNEVISITRTGFQIYRGARKADEKLSAAKKLSDSLDDALSKLESVSGEDDRITHQVQVAREACRDLRQYLDGFRHINAQDKGKRKVSGIYDRVVWSVRELDGKVAELQYKIDIAIRPVELLIVANTRYVHPWIRARVLAVARCQSSKRSLRGAHGSLRP